MKREELFEKAYALKTQRMEKRLNEWQVFALQIRNQLHYVQMQGNEKGKDFTIVVYPGQEGLKNYLEIADVIGKDPLETVAMFHDQNGQTLLFGDKDSLIDDEEQEIRAFTKAHGISLRGKNMWPRMMRLHSFQPATLVMDGDENAEILGCAMDALMWLACDEAGKQLAVPEVCRGAKEILLLRRELQGYSAELIPMPEIPAPVYPAGKNSNEMYTARVRQLKKQGTWGCEIMATSAASPAEGVEGLYFPWRLVTYDFTRKRSIEVQRVRDYVNRTEVMLDKLMEAMFREDVCPETIEVYHDRTEAFLRDWCEKVGIALVRVGETPQRISDLEMLELLHMNDLDDSIEAFDDYDPEDDDFDDPFDFDDDDEDDDFYDEEDDEELNKMMRLMDASLEVILRMPDEMLMQDLDTLQEQLAYLNMMKDMPMISAQQLKKINDATKRVDKLLSKQKKSQNGKKKGRGKKTPEKSYVISVSLGTGCYRHIQISNHDMLEDLSDAILDAFDFYNDHAHGFFMDNLVYSRWNCYYMRGVDSRYPTTDRTSLEEAGLETGLKFKYLFDFGDDWIFQCKVLKELNEVTPSPVIVRSKGNAPEQYPDWDENE